MARPGWPERNKAARSFRQLRRFHHVINSDKVFGTHRLFASFRSPAGASGSPRSTEIFRDYPAGKRVARCTVFAPQESLVYAAHFLESPMKFVEPNRFNDPDAA